MSTENKKTVSSDKDGLHEEDDNLAPRSKSVLPGIFKTPGSTEVETDTLVAALGDGVSLDSIPDNKNYEGELILDCDGVTNLAASMIVALNFDQRLATGKDPTQGKCPFEIYEALKIMSKKFTQKSYDFRMKLENMEVGELLGKGKYAHVWNTVFNGQSVALKEVDPRRAKSADLYKERDMLVYLKNERVCGILGAWYQGNCYFLLERCIGSLVDVAKDLSERQRFIMCVDLLEGLEFIHSKGIIHCDIRPENCLVKHGIRLCIGDFGRAQIIPKNTVAIKAKVSLGNICYQDAATNKYYIYSRYSDIFAAACVIFELTTNGSHLLRYADPAVGDVNDYITAFEIGRRKGVLHTRHINDEKYIRETLLQRVTKSNLGNLLAGMISFPWSDRFSAGMAKHHPDITNQIAAYQSEKVTNVVEPPVYVNEDVLFARPKRTMPENIGIGWHVKAFSCMYYDAEDIRPVKEQVTEGDVNALPGNNIVQPSGAPTGKDIRADISGADDGICNTQTKLRTPCDAKQQEQMGVETRTKKIDDVSTRSATFQDVQGALAAALTNLEKTLLAKINVKTGQSELPPSNGVSTNNQTENAIRLIECREEEEDWGDFHLSAENNKVTDNALHKTRIQSPKDDEYSGGIEVEEKVEDETGKKNYDMEDDDDDENEAKSSPNGNTSNGENLIKQGGGANSKPETTGIKKRMGRANYEETPKRTPFNIFKKTLRLERSTNSSSNNKKNENARDQSLKPATAIQKEPVASIEISDADDGDWPASCRKIVRPQHSGRFAKPGTSGNKEERSSKSHTSRQSASDGGRSSKSSSKHISDDGNFSSSKLKFNNKIHARNDGIRSSKSDTGNIKGGSSNLKSSKKSIEATPSSSNRQEKWTPSKSSGAGFDSTSSKSNRAGDSSRNKRELTPLDDHLGARARILTSKGGRSSGGKLESETNVLPSDAKLKSICAPGAKVSGLYKRSLPPSASTVKSKKARGEECDPSNKVVYTHRCSYCGGRFASKQNAKDHQRDCSARPKK